MKKTFIIIVVFLILVLISLTRYISFSEVNGIVKDENGNGIADSSVVVNRQCAYYTLAGDVAKSYQYFKIYTNKNGDFQLEPLSIGFKMFLHNCRTTFFVSKDEYCGSKLYDRCLNEIKKRKDVESRQELLDNPITPASSGLARMFSRGELSCYFGLCGAVIPEAGELLEIQPKENSVIIRLNKVE